MYINNKDLILDTIVASDNSVKPVNSLLNNSSDAEMSLSPSIIIPLRTNDDEPFKVRTLLDPGSGTNWIVISLLKFLKHTVIGSETLEVVTFSGSIKKRFPLVEIFYKDVNFNTHNLLCYAHESYTRHITVKGMVDYICSRSKTKYTCFDSLVDPASMEIDHFNKSQGIGLILCSSSINKIRSDENVILIPEIEILLEPTIFGVAISGAIPLSLRNRDNIVLANNISPRLVCS